MLTSTARHLNANNAQNKASLDDSIRKIAVCSVEQSVRCKLFFEDYDRLRKGYVHPSKFVTALDNIKCSFTKGEIDALLEH